MPILHRYAHACGPSLAESYWVGLRYDDQYGFDHRRMESWVLGPPAPGSQIPTPILTRLGRMTELWRSPSGHAFVPAFSGAIHHIYPAPRSTGERWRTEALKGVLSGAWGLSDNLVMVFGEDGFTGEHPTHVMYMWDGGRWRLIPSPGQVNGMDGASPDLIYAVGHEGLIARWDGGAWQRIASPTTTSLNRVVIVDENEMYAAGPGRRLLLGSIYGWTEVLVAPFDIHGLARVGDTVYVSSAHGGLWTLKDGQLVPAKAKVDAERITSAPRTPTPSAATSGPAKILATTAQAIVELTNELETARVDIGGFIWLSNRQPPLFRMNQKLGAPPART